jgi:hypothetical protein
MPKVMDSRGNWVEVQPPLPIVVNGTFKINPELVGKNPAYKSIHSTSINLPLKWG